MQTYASDYRGSYTDEWYSEDQHGLTQTEYYDLKKSMLKSIYENGGFYIGRYEIGSFDEPVTSINNTRQTVIQQGAYPYNWVTCSQAQKLSEGLAIGKKTSSLMFGIQCDLVLKFLETKGILQSDLKVDSSSWGNFSNVTFDINRGKYSIDYGTSYTQIESIYSKPASGVLLTTGSTKRNSKMNIYDLAGNVWEWTLETSTDNDNPCSCRGCGYGGNGSTTPVFHRNSYNTLYANNYVGFRSTLY